MTTYKKLTWDSYKIQVESAVRDGNGATISTTYATKTEVTTGLGTKLDTTVAASTYATQTALTDGLAAKADKATSLAGYGITDGVTTNTAQTITEVKTFTHPSGAIILKNNSAYSSGQEWSPYLDFKTDTGDVAVGRVYARRDSSDNGNMVIDVRNPNSGDWKGAVSLACDSSEAWFTAPFRAYNSANVNDVVTIGSLAANPNVVHTTGNETVSGYKVFTNDLSISEEYNPYFVTQTNNIPSRSALGSASTYYTRWEWRAANGDVLGAIQFVHNANSNSTEIQVCSINNGSEYWRALQ